MKPDFKNISIGKAKDLILESIVREENRLKQSEEFLHEFSNATLKDINFSLKSIVDSNLDLINVYFGNQTYITKVGHIRPFLQSGGFQKIEELEKQKNRKEVVDFKISKFKYYTFWPFFVFALFGFGLSIYNFVETQKKQDNVNRTEQRIKKLETEIKHLHILKLDQNSTELNQRTVQPVTPKK